MNVEGEHHIRFLEISYTSVRNGMMQHIAFRRQTVLAVAAFSVAVSAWLLESGRNDFLVQPIVSSLPFLVLLIGWTSTEATTKKIIVHSKYLQEIEESYERNSKFKGYEKHLREQGDGTFLGFLLSDRIWMRIVFALLGCAQIVILGLSKISDH